jgi:beta-N-acetylhexosaminidase
MTDQPTLTNSVADPHLMLAFEGTDVPEWVSQSLEHGRPAGFTLFRGWNIESPSQAAELTSDLQARNKGDRPLLIAGDQEGGQLQALAGSTPFSGNMALGATGDDHLAREVGTALGRELRAVGINVNYAPAVDVATLPSNPSLGVRSFGSDPESVATLAAAVAAGMADAGVLATAKHFPGKGEAAVDPHYELPLLDLTRERMDRVELAPFSRLFAAGIPLTMVGHYLVPSLTGSTTEPISVSRHGLSTLRGDLGFKGVIISDALDMKALDQGSAQVVEFIAMMNAGIDLLLCMPDPELRGRAITALEKGHERELISEASLAASRDRIEVLRSSIPVIEPDPSVVGSRGHQALASRLAQRSITLVRTDAKALPLTTSGRLLVLEPEPSNVTPADTTALYPPVLAEELARYHPSITAKVYPQNPSKKDISELVAVASGHDFIVVGSVVAPESQGRLVTELVATGIPVIALALRTPFDILEYPSVSTYIATYSSHRPAMEALAGMLFGKQGFSGKLPAPIEGLYQLGHGLR